MGHIGLLGGTFNPPHMGHLACARHALDELSLDSVRLVPVHTPPHKEAAQDPGVDVRLELCRAAVADDPQLQVSGIEAGRPGPSYTVDTLREIHANEPGDELTFIVGADMARSLPAWREPEAVLALATLGVAEREGVGHDEVLEPLGAIPGARERVRFFDMPRIDVSSSLVRSRVAAGRSIRHLVPAGVAALIEARGLYAAQPGRPIS